ncbi:MAG: hypothetical protein FJW39_11750, partial [Acidobacteria bacterium]|nr:hypothetical protein [Acidobacteriota bacterium]
ALGSGFAVTAAWPSALDSLIVDDCGDPLTAGTASVSFTNGDPPLTLKALGQGRWSGTWQPKNGVANIVLTLNAETVVAPLIKGTAQIGGSAANNTTTPVIFSGGVVSGASLARDTPQAPGGYVAILGRALTAAPANPQTLPLPPELSGTQVILGGKRLALESVAEGRITAVLPYDLTPNSTLQLVIRRANTLSMPESVVVAAAQPAVFTMDGSGRGAAVVTAKRGDAEFEVSAEEPATAGDELTILCSGLGPVTPEVAAGAAGPEDPLATVINPVTAMLAGTEVPVAFAGLAPGKAGVYWVKLVVPEGLPAGDGELVLSSSGASSPAVTVAVK